MFGREIEKYLPELQFKDQAANPGTFDSVASNWQSFEIIVPVPVIMRKPLSWALDCINGVSEMPFQIETELTMLVSMKFARI